MESCQPNKLLPPQVTAGHCREANYDICILFWSHGASLKASFQPYSLGVSHLFCGLLYMVWFVFLTVTAFSLLRWQLL